MSKTTTVDDTKSFFGIKKDVLFDKKNFLTYAGIVAGGIAVLVVGRYFFRKVNDIRKRKLIELKQLIIEERLRSKAIVDLHTDEEIIVHAKKNDTTATFMFRYMENLKLKENAPPSKPYPFLPPFDAGIFITDLPPSHRLIFNRYAVLKNHVLVVTSAFEEQISPLNVNDFAASFKVLLALRGFCFYNSGPNSGASQPHKHVQVLPALKEDKHGIFGLIDKEAIRHESPFKCSIYSFAHLICPLPNFGLSEKYNEIGAKLEEIYKDMIKKLKIDTRKDSYNLIMNENWMMIVKRSKGDAFDILSVNSLGFIGQLLLKGPPQKKLAQEKTPFEILDDITVHDD